MKEYTRISVKYKLACWLPYMSFMYEYIYEYIYEEDVLALILPPLIFHYVPLDSPSRFQVSLSMILKWYGGDFGSTNNELLAKLVQYMVRERKSRLHSRDKKRNIETLLSALTVH